MKKKSYKRFVKGAIPIERSCTLKRRHPTEMDARLEAKKTMIINRGRVRSMSVYPCENCAGWHVSSRLHGARRRVSLDEVGA